MRPLALKDASIRASGLEVCEELFVLSFAILYFIRNFARS